jgi:hypothetical protein
MQNEWPLLCYVNLTLGFVNRDGVYHLERHRGIDRLFVIISATCRVDVEANCRFAHISEVEPIDVDRRDTAIQPRRILRPPIKQTLRFRVRRTWCSSLLGPIPTPSPRAREREYDPEREELAGRMAVG